MFINENQMFLLTLLFSLYVATQSAFLDFSSFDNDTATEISMYPNFAYVEQNVTQLYQTMMQERGFVLLPNASTEGLGPVDTSSDSWDDGFTILNEKKGLQEKVLQEIVRVKNESMTVLEVCTEGTKGDVTCDQVYMFYMLTKEETEIVKRNLRVA